MQAVAKRALRLARRKGPLLLVSSKALQYRIISLRSASTTSHSPVTRVPSPRSTQMRGISYVLISAFGGLGAWYALRDSGFSRSLVSSGSSGFGFGGSRLSGSDKARSFMTGPGSSDRSPRRVMVMDKEDIIAVAVDIEEALMKATDSGYKVIELMSPDQVTERLRRNEESWLNGRGRGVVRYDMVQIPSNDPIEDDHAEKIVEIPTSAEGEVSGDWSFWGVFDGHSGWTTSATLRQLLIPFVVRELNQVHSGNQPPDSDTVDEAIKTGFTRLDNEIVHAAVDKAFKDGTRAMAAKTLAPALSGSCALLSFFDSKTDTMKVACTGDSRAILGRKTASGKWTALPLSIDQTGSNPEEAARVRREHPGEPGVIHAGRVLGGLEPSRAFGDAIYKWSPDVQRRLRSNFFTRNPHRSLQTPPYVTAEPVVTTTKIQPGNGDFVVMATDGLWEMLTNEEVVGLVGWWLDEEHSRNLSQSKSSNGTSILSPGGGSSWLRRLLSKPLRDLPIEKSTPSSSSDEADASGESKAGQKRPIRQQQWDLDTKSPDLNRFVCEDRNVATHLVRNALGGKNGDTVAALLTLSSPHSRRYRDDLTVNVVFFGDEGEDASDSPDRIIRNKDASVGQDGQRTGLSEDLKAKL